MNNKQAILDKFKRKYVYFEKQTMSKLCGLHALNALLQGPFFNEIILSEIGNELDQMEKSLYNDEHLKEFISKPSLNQDDYGNYNIQVLTEALKKFDIEISPIKHQDAQKMLEEQMDSLEAFIFNSTDHWFTIRKIDGIWFNLNSTNENPGPQIISEFYLSAFLKGTEDLGYTNFIVKNLHSLPSLDDEIYKDLKYPSKLVKIDDILNKKVDKINMGDGNQYDIERAIELSKKEYMENNFEGQVFDKKESEYNFEFDDIRKAMENSLNETLNDLRKQLPVEPKDDELCLNLHFIEASNGNLFSRRFNYSDKIRDLNNFCKVKLRTVNDVMLMNFNNNTVYNDAEISIKDAKINDNDTISVEIILIN